MHLNKEGRLIPNLGNSPPEEDPPLLRLSWRLGERGVVVSCGQDK